MEEGDPVYVKLGYGEALGSKRDVLSLEISLLNIIRIIKRYNSLRAKELGIRLEISNIIKGIDLSMKKTKKSFPSVKAPGKTKKEEAVKKEIKIVQQNFDEDIESQLRKIQEKLRSISS